jgi:hypothetical protein
MVHRNRNGSGPLAGGAGLALVLATCVRIDDPRVVVGSGGGTGGQSGEGTDGSKGGVSGFTGVQAGASAAGGNITSGGTGGSGDANAGSGGDAPASGGNATTGGSGEEGGAGSGEGGAAGSANPGITGGASAGTGRDGGSSSCTVDTVSWTEEFTATSLDVAWSLFEYTGARNNSLTSPANHYSLSDRPGAFRYYDDPMTHAGAWHNYVPYYDSPYYYYDPGLEIGRDLGGERWVLEVRAEYYLENVINAAYHEVAVHFGAAGTQGLHCALNRFSNDDVGQGNDPDHNNFYADCMLNGTRLSEYFTEWAGLDVIIARTIRFERNGDQLELSVQNDGAEVRQVLSLTLPEQFQCAQQKFLIGGASWFYPQGSYADYDYVRFERLD